MTARGRGLDLRWHLQLAKRKANRTPPRISRPRGEVVRNRLIADRYVYSLDTLQSIATPYGISRERVRQIVEQFYTREQAKKHRAAVRAMRDEAVDRYRRSIAPPCKVCGEPSVRSLRAAKYLTCSPRCARAWQAFAQADDEEASNRHRVYLARSILRHQEGKKPSQVAWAKRIVAAVESGQPLPPRNRTLTRFSKLRPAFLEESA
jgi:hypothetical protein